MASHGTKGGAVIPGPTPGGCEVAGVATPDPGDPLAEMLPGLSMEEAGTSTQD